ncbi:hypothetical protein SAMN05421878_11610 [Actinobaculum suis]|uniref:Beta-carotene 15,15'-monooxygenase n=1 Tax=Actinobaculum suis TaxID=1657 RepID=A0A1G7EA43_9ACTO|nr:hypothetical protein [Actinobaculum suis]MDY5153023.1 beta-carotene 15,15'-monooxygenase [Actinobaculum suis]SDE60450.1 hypothetical protein SAMN05421878_11610 [Actinobaculum suis]
MRRKRRRRALVAAAGALAAAGTRAILRRREHSAWQRTAHDGRQVSLEEGVVAAAGLSVTAGLSAVGGAALLATGGAATAGYIDDTCAERFAENPKGLRGHLGALRRGVLTSGNVKLMLIASSAALSARALRQPGDIPFFDTAVRTGLIAGGANIINLFDLRPGRALKVAGLAALPLLGNSVPLPASRLAAGVCGVGLVCAEDDLSGKTMLGDTGANAFGATLGTAWALLPRRTVRCAILAGLVGLTLASERVSFSKIIAETPILRSLDEAGRR